MHVFRAEPLCMAGAGRNGYYESPLPSYLLRFYGIALCCLLCFFKGTV
jgi:hypothetical protein